MRAYVAATLVFVVVIAVVLGSGNGGGSDSRALGCIASSRRREVQRQMLSVVFETLYRRRIQHWLMYSTLRDWSRHRKLGDHAFDVDIGILASQRMAVITILRDSLDASVYEVLERPLSVVHRDSGFALTITTLSDAAPDINTILFPLQHVLLDGVDAFVPRAYEQLLVAWYPRSPEAYVERERRAASQQASLATALSERPMTSRQ